MPDWDARLSDHDNVSPNRACEFCGDLDTCKMGYPDGSIGYVCYAFDCERDYQNACLEVKGDLDGHARREEG